MKVLTSSVAIMLLLAGCATRDYVQEQVNPVTGRVQSVEGRMSSAESVQQANSKAIAEIQVPLRAHADRIARTEAELAQLSKTAQEAVERADRAGQLAQGRMVYEVVLTDDKLHFASESAVLDKAAQTTLFVEIQGHTDKTGHTAANLQLGEKRAETVLRYLNMQGGIPLHRMNAISYGETRPVADNKTPEGRRQNRRVVLVVIQ